MPTKECPSCAMEIDASDKVCPICGYEFPVQSKIYVWVAVLLLLIGLLYFII